VLYDIISISDQRSPDSYSGFVKLPLKSVVSHRKWGSLFDGIGNNLWS